MMRGKILGAVVAGALTLATLTGCTASDQRIIDSFTEPKTIAHPEKTGGVSVEDPSMRAYRESQPTMAATKKFTVKVYGSVKSAQITVDDDQTPVMFTPYKQEFEAAKTIVVTGVTKSKTGGCTILDAAGTIVDKETDTGKGQLFTCIYAK